MILLEINIFKASKWKDALIRNLKLPDECVITAILRKDTVVFPRGYVEIKEGDKVLLVTKVGYMKEIKRYVNGG
jgi:trk system potassium uptake protein TrkA